MEELKARLNGLEDRLTLTMKAMQNLHKGLEQIEVSLRHNDKDKSIIYIMLLMSFTLHLLDFFK
jgi:hypothetical protein